VADRRTFHWVSSCSTRQPGAQGTIEAYLQLGSVYEHAGVGNVSRNLSIASDYYKAASNACSVIQDLKLRQLLFTQGFYGQRDRFRLDAWNEVEDALSFAIGARFNWSLAGQVFIVGAAASLSSNVQLDHYTPLLVLLPLLLGLALQRTILNGNGIGAITE
jgi:hypothetical protein